VTFSSANYLPTIDPPKEYLYCCACYRASWNAEKLTSQPYLLAIAIVRQWIGISDDGVFLARYAFLNLWVWASALHGMYESFLWISNAEQDLFF
jgi:hypothetical protein